jgi:4-diphosphocytidyl-2-C-methyl-D-erythritol kinase
VEERKMMLMIPAYAKLNLTLDVLGRREDGYHDLRMVMQSVSLADQVMLEFIGGAGITVRTDLGFLPCDQRNLAWSAAEAFARATGRPVDGLSISIEKHIPVCAGTAGGSSDAAAVLRGLNELLETGLSPVELAKVGELVGSDVPYCVLGGTALAEGRGEVLTPLPALPPCWVVMCKPEFSISTPELFHAADNLRLRCHPDTEGVLRALARGDLDGIVRRMYNVFEDVLPASKANEIRAIKSALLGKGALGACMSGTGPTVFGLFRDRETAEDARQTLGDRYRETFLAEPMGRN